MRLVLRATEKSTTGLLYSTNRRNTVPKNQFKPKQMESENYDLENEQECLDINKKEKKKQR